MWKSLFVLEELQRYMAKERERKTCSTPTVFTGLGKLLQVIIKYSNDPTLHDTSV